MKQRCLSPLTVVPTCKRACVCGRASARGRGRAGRRACGRARGRAWCVGVQPRGLQARVARRRALAGVRRRARVCMKGWALACESERGRAWRALACLGVARACVGVRAGGRRAGGRAGGRARRNRGPFSVNLFCRENRLRHYSRAD